jgi:hypothetical protein
MESLPSDDFVKVLITLWAIWEARSYSWGDFLEPIVYTLFRSELSWWLSLGHSAEDFFGSSSNTGRLSGQIPPPKNLVKENEDGAVSRDNGEGWDAIILREKDGHYLGSSSIVFPKLLIHHLWKH